MNQNKIALALAISSFILSIGASVYMSFWGASYAATNLETGEIPVVGRRGAFHPILIILTLLPAAGLIGVLRRNRLMLRAAAVGMFLLVMLSMLGAGLLFLPSALLLIVATVSYAEEI